MECLKIISIFRFILPEKELKVAGGREVCLRDLQSWIFFAGADSTMIGNYLTTYGRSADEDRQMVRDLGLEIEDFCESEARSTNEVASGGAGVSPVKCGTGVSPVHGEVNGLPPNLIPPPPEAESSPSHVQYLEHVT